MKYSNLSMATITSALLEAYSEELEGDDETDPDEAWHPKKLRKTHNGRERRYINSIFKELGPHYVRRAYRMESPSFWKLLAILDPYLDAQTKFKSSTIQKGGGAKNGLISNATRLMGKSRTGLLPHFPGHGGHHWTPIREACS